jgi:hypothetical protein
MKCVSINLPAELLRMVRLVSRLEKAKAANRAMIVSRSVVYGVPGMAALLAIYFVILAAVSGWEFTLSQFFDFWYFIVTLAAGFGIQIGLYSYLRNAVRAMDMSGNVIACREALRPGR